MQEVTDDVLRSLGIPARAFRAPSEDTISATVHEFRERRLTRLRERMERRIIRPMIDRVLKSQEIVRLEPLFLCSPRGTMFRVVRGTFADLKARITWE